MSEPSAPPPSPAPELPIVAAPYPRLSKAPITEAVIHFRTSLAPGRDITLFKELLHSRLREEYPILQEQHDFEATLQLNPKQKATDENSTRDRGVSAYLFRSEDQKNVVQFRGDGFAFSRLKPYVSWDETFSEAWRLWELYRDAAEPLEISRTGVRFINRLTFPYDNGDLRQYLTAPPTIAPTWPRAMSAFFNRATLHDPEKEADIQVIQMLEDRQKMGVLPVILDIDVSSTRVINPTDPGLVGRLMGFREMKNRIFFGALTEKAIKFFQQ